MRPIRDDPQNPKQITRISAASPFNPTEMAFDHRFNLFTKDYNYEGNDEEATLYTKRSLRCCNRKGPPTWTLVAAYAAGALYLKAGRGRSWLTDFTAFGNRGDVRELTRIADVANLRLTDAVKPSKDIDEDPRQGPARFVRDIPKFYSTNYGGRDASGRDYGGLFGEELEHAGRLQVNIFFRNAQLWLLKTLMGDNVNNVLVGKSGRIGYVYGVLDGAAQAFSEFLAFLTKVEEERHGPVQPRLKAEDLRNRRLAGIRTEGPRPRCLVSGHLPRRTRCRSATSRQSNC